jgi:hypothetical protein
MLVKQASVLSDQPKPKTLDHQGKRVLPQVGDPLHLRLIVAVVTDHAGKTLGALVIAE